MDNLKVKSAMKIVYTQLERTYPNINWNKTFINGGAITSILSGWKVREYDMFFKDEEVMRQVIAEIEKRANVKITIEKTGENRFRITSDKIYNKIIRITENSIRYGIHDFVIRIVGTPEEAIVDFDFVHNTIYYDRETDEVVASPEAIAAFKLQHLYVHRIVWNQTILQRIIKYTSKGWKLPASEALVILYYIQKHFNFRKAVKSFFELKNIQFNSSATDDELIAKLKQISKRNLEK